MKAYRMRMDGKVDEAKPALEREFAKRRDKDPRVQANLGLQHAWLGDVEKATVHANNALTLDQTRRIVISQELPLSGAKTVWL